eukprot:TRINITY_DN5222_c0_g4_i1.p1 TRINITY_DN5222_c0_g4~~TRINITY_DN5222_c0_g4_i1.p1  ORF type:complete len:2068 (+),score=428.69 TRINITY_DN5222_c0_g4_i1:77-6280(+)
MGWQSLSASLRRWDHGSKPSDELEAAVEEVVAAGDEDETLRCFSDALDPSLQRGSGFLQQLARTKGAKCRCDAVWYGDTIAYGCKTCGLSSASCICVFCFDAGDHEGHDFYISRSDYGCCDCGDAHAWKVSGFCKHHTGPRRDVDPTQLLPETTRRRAQVLVPRQVRRLLQLPPRLADVLPVEMSASSTASAAVLHASSQNVVGRETAQVDAPVDVVPDERSAVETAAAMRPEPFGDVDFPRSVLLTGINLRVGEDMLRDFIREHTVGGRLDSLLQSMELVRDSETKASKGRAYLFVHDGWALEALMHINGKVLRGSCVRVHYVQEAVELAEKHLTSWEVNFEWLLTLGGFHDGLRKIIGEVFLELSHAASSEQAGLSAVEILLRSSHVMEPSVRKLETNLMVDLMLDLDFKFRFAQVFTRLYRELVLARAGHQDTSELGDFTCQIFTRQDVTLELVREHDLVRNLLSCLWDLLQPALTNRFPAPPVFNHQSTIFRDHEIIQCSMDLLYVLDHAEVAKEIVRNPKLRCELWEGWVRILLAMQAMNPHTRRTRSHVEYTNTAWGNALTLHTDLMSNTWLILDAMETKASLEAVQEMARWTWSQLQLWLRAANNGETNQQDLRVGISFQVSQQATSFHIPVNRVLALLIHQLCTRGGLTGREITAASSSTSTVKDTFMTVGFMSDAEVLWWMEHPLRALVLHSQIAGGMWRRNGEAAENESDFYRMNYWHHLLIDMDLLTLRLAALILRPDAFLYTLISRFELTPFSARGDPLKHMTASGVCTSSDDEHLTSKMQSFVLLLYHLLSPYTPLSLTFAELVVHNARQHLSIGPKTHSQLWDPRLERSTATATAKDQQMLEAALKKISKFSAADESGSGHSAAKYSLKDDQWVGVDPYFHLFTWGEIQKAEENIMSALRSKNQTLSDWFLKTVDHYPRPREVYRAEFEDFVRSREIQALVWLLLCKMACRHIKDSAEIKVDDGRLIVLTLALALRAMQAPVPDADEDMNVEEEEPPQDEEMPDVAEQPQAPSEPTGTHASEEPPSAAVPQPAPEADVEQGEAQEVGDGSLRHPSEETSLLDPPNTPESPPLERIPEPPAHPRRPAIREKDVQFFFLAMRLGCHLVTSARKLFHAETATFFTQEFLSEVIKKKKLKAPEMTEMCLLDAVEILCGAPADSLTGGLARALRTLLLRDERNMAFMASRPRPWYLQVWQEDVNPVPMGSDPLASDPASVSRLRSGTGDSTSTAGAAQDLARSPATGPAEAPAAPTEEELQAQEEARRAKKRKAAQERQRRMLNDLKKKQEAFFSGEEGQKMLGEAGSSAESSAPECVVCMAKQDDEEGDNPLGLLCFLRTANASCLPRERVPTDSAVLLHTQRMQASRIDLQASSSSGPQCWARESTDGLIAARACSHRMHYNCWRRYRPTALANSGGRLACPYCSTVVNALLPATAASSSSNSEVTLGGARRDPIPEGMEASADSVEPKRQHADASQEFFKQLKEHSQRLKVLGRPTWLPDDLAQQLEIDYEAEWVHYCRLAADNVQLAEVKARTQPRAATNLVAGGAEASSSSTAAAPEEASSAGAAHKAVIKSCLQEAVAAAPGGLASKLAEFAASEAAEAALAVFLCSARPHSRFQMLLTLLVGLCENKAGTGVGRIQDATRLIRWFYLAEVVLVLGAMASEDLVNTELAAATAALAEATARGDTMAAASAAAAQAIWQHVADGVAAAGPLEEDARCTPLQTRQEVLDVLRLSLNPFCAKVQILASIIVPRHRSALEDPVKLRAMPPVEEHIFLTCPDIGLPCIEELLNFEGTEERTALAVRQVFGNFSPRWVSQRGLQPSAPLLLVRVPAQPTGDAADDSPAPAPADTLPSHIWDVPSSAAEMLDRLLAPNRLHVCFLGAPLQGTRLLCMAYRLTLPPITGRVYQKFYTQFVHARCTTCKTPPQIPALCLLCGTFLCCHSECCRSAVDRTATGSGSPTDGTTMIGEVTRHAQACGFGASVFLQLSNSLVHVVADGFIASWGSLYLDGHGEEEYNLSRPLYISEARLQQLTQSIREVTFDFESRLKWKKVVFV